MLDFLLAIPYNSTCKVQITNEIANKTLQKSFKKFQIST